MTVSVQDETFVTADRQVKEAEQAAKINPSVYKPWKATEMEVKKNKEKKKNKKKQRNKNIIITH